jgi:hypothetical protein
LTGLRLVKRYRPAALWTTFPIPTAHLIGRSLHTHTGLPWIADFRDPMVQPGDPSDPLLWSAYERVEKATVFGSQLNIFTTPGTCALYRARYPQTPAARFAVVENGYDEDVFSSLPEIGVTARPPVGQLLLLHSGAIYPLERDPTQLFLALSDLRRRGVVSSDTVKVRLRATGHDPEIARLITKCEVGDLVELAPPVSYREAITEMIASNGLLIFQASQVKTQVPAKVYEYLRTGRPIMALTDPDGDTAKLLAAAGVRHIARIDSRENIMQVMADFLDGIRNGKIAKPDPEFVKRASRRNRTRDLAALLERVTAQSAP